MTTPLDAPATTETRQPTPRSFDGRTIPAGTYILEYGITVSRYAGNYQLWVVGSNHHVYESWTKGSSNFTSWKDLGGYALSQVTFSTGVTSGGAKWIQIFVTGKDGNKWCKDYNGTRELAWAPSDTDWRRYYE
ncbi:hypothetical protein JIG36_34945 [Actinoplanes sp. LDG1-06]|uniref:Uncharacterized protein n=1 Tax=Paractinoplanes ovalisporus TaxID=2810368 RepID=A0ABS2ALL9_9ACTN|nr:hypothetical protein [Actinoplanes ovalisporus]MBM2620710.1 hypothetical protein [Actinoplanes ovalisporus]